jgi:hypothetical protein
MELAATSNPNVPPGLRSRAIAKWLIEKVPVFSELDLHPSRNHFCKLGTAGAHRGKSGARIVPDFHPQRGSAAASDTRGVAIDIILLTRTLVV